MGRLNMKDLFREIKASFGRFFAIFAICLIGVAFFAGVTASSDDMKHSADQYYDRNNMMDIKLLSTVGFHENDIEAIRGIEGVDGVFAGHNMDAVTVVDHVQSTLKVMSLPDTNLDSSNTDYINQLRIKEGRLPQNNTECVVKYETTKGNLVEVGDTITLASDTSKPIEESLENPTLTVVGIVYTPYYLSYDMGTSTVGNGHIGFCVFVPNSAFLENYYTEVFATVEGAKKLNTYSDAYFKKVDRVIEDIKTMSRDKISSNIDSIKKEFEDEKVKRRQEADEQIRQNVIDQLTKQYQTFYPGLDVTDMIAPYIESAYNKAVASFDFTQVDEAVDQAMKETLEDSDQWKWYGLSRKEIYSFRDYESSANRMAAIATVFPLFFFFVAGLVCLTTMTRMVDEQRELIGTYKALGYGKFAIAYKYMMYALIASVSGGIIGCMIGLRLFPTVVYNTWNIVYEMPKISYDSHWGLSIIAIASMVLVTVLATLYACVHELSAMPSMLMRPKAPKKGKKILLEHLPFVWKRFSFTMKVTMRNLFRYKKRFVMTVVGIAGCTALLMAGFGIKDSISSLVTKQYQEILQYDMEMTFSGSADNEMKESLYQDLKQDSRINTYMTDYSYSSEVYSDASDESKTASISVVSDKEQYKQFVAFRKRRGNQSVPLDDQGVLISEKLSNDLHVKKGDVITLEDGTGAEYQVVVSGIIEMYVNHYVFMSDAYYEQITGKKVNPNRILGKMTDSSVEAENLTGEKYLAMDAVSSITFFTANIDKFNNMIKSLNIITYVLIVSAASLAFVVLYNLTNVNISERIREIATIKVLGFYDVEVGSYVYRENALITIIGSIAGIFLGVLLHGYIMKTVELDAVMFGNAIHWSSYVISLVLTMIFAAFVNLVMYKRLQRIPMVESLKSIE
ncbi:MAG: ABC transporter permease [Lachnospira sp.]|nr:ABC transporter permease [Lachnospira sp.]